MIHFSEPDHRAEPEVINRFQWLSVFASGLIAGGVLLIVPHGTPWSKLTFFAPVIMGRVLPSTWNLSFSGSVVLHLTLSLIFALVVSIAVMRATQLRGVIVGGVIGFVLYLANLGIVSLWFPELRGNELSVMLAHVVFGMIAGGAYRGLLRRSVRVVM